MSFVTSPNMGLQIPGVGTEAGPAYASEVNNSLSTVDGHNHTTGSGVLIPVAGLNINADFPLGGFNLTQARTLRLAIQTSQPSQPSDIAALYVEGVDLYYIDGGGNNIRITNSGSVAGPFGTITGLPNGTASAAYASGTFVFQSMTNVGAIIDGASYILRNSVSGSPGLTLQPPLSMASNYSLTLPALPSQQNIMMLDTLGNITAPLNVDGSTIVISSNALQVPAGGITDTQIASATITGDRIAASTITGSNIAGSTITGSNIASATITGANIAANTIYGSNIGTGQVDISNMDASVNYSYYTPSYSVVSGIGGVTMGLARVMRMGNVIMVGGSINISPTVGVGNSCIVNVANPTGSTTNINDAYGTISSTGPSYITGPAFGAGSGYVTLAAVSTGSPGNYGYFYMYTA